MHSTTQSLIEEFDLPGDKGVLDNIIQVPGTNIEIIRPYDGTDIRAVLFDLDGVLSSERVWIDLMVEKNSSALARDTSMSIDKARELVIEDIQKTIGLPTYVQMQRLAKMVEAAGGTPLKVHQYKSVYTRALNKTVAEVYRQLENNELKLSDIRVYGAIDLLEALKRNHEFRRRKGELYLASGTDIEAVRKSVKILRYDDSFDEDHIVAAGSTDDPKQCAKELTIRRLVEEKGLKPGQLLTVEDGFPGVLHTYRAGGICVGVLTPDISSYEGKFTLEQKRERLIAAGAHILVPDFGCAYQLVNVIRRNYLTKQS